MKNEVGGSLKQTRIKTHVTGTKRKNLMIWNHMVPEMRKGREKISENNTDNNNNNNTDENIVISIYGS